MKFSIVYGAAAAAAGKLNGAKSILWRKGRRDKKKMADDFYVYKINTSDKKNLVIPNYAAGVTGRE